MSKGRTVGEQLTVGVLVATGGVETAAVEWGEIVGDVEGEEGDGLQTTVTTYFVVVFILVAVREGIRSRESVDESEGVPEDVGVPVGVIFVGRNVAVQVLDRVSGSEFVRTDDGVNDALRTSVVNAVDEFEIDGVPVAKIDDVRVTECVGMTVSVREGDAVGDRTEDAVGV
jgi:hypothetical protein